MKCWYCQENTMNEASKLGKDWFKCSKCGATHQENPIKVAREQLVEVERAGTTGESKYKPGGAVIARARKIREGTK